MVLDSSMRVTNANQAFYRAFDVTQTETEGRAIYELGNGQWNIPALRELLEKVLPNDGRVEDFEVRHNFPGGQRTMMLNARRVEPQPGHPVVLLYIEDVTKPAIPRIAGGIRP